MATMKDQNKTKAQLIAELEEIRQHVSELEQNEAERERPDKALEDSNETLLAILDSIDADVYISDMENYEILFMNQHMRSSFGNNLVGKICWQVFRGESGPCPHCTNDQLLDSDDNPADVVIWEGKNPITENWYINHDRAIKWTDGRIVRLQVATDVTDRKHLELSLQESERLLRQVIDTSPYSIFVKDRDGRYVLVNKTMAESHNTSPEAMVGRTDLSVAEKWLKNPEEIERFRASEREVTDRKNTTFTKEEKFTFRDGTERWFQTVKTPISLKDNPNCLMGIAVDVTERVLAEQALRESEAKMRSIFKASPTGIGLVANRMLLDVNEKICEMLGYSQEELIGKSARVLYPTDDDYEYVGREKYAQIQEKGTGTVETRWERKDGQIINVLLSSTPLDLTDLSAGVTFTALDITERVKAEEALRESEARYRTLFEHANDAIFLENQNDEIVDVNRQACELMGYNRNELLQMTVSDLQAPEVRGERGNVLKQELEKHSGGLFESLNLHRDGTRIPVEISTASIPGRDDGLALAIVRDVTERKRAEKGLKASEMRFATIFRANPAAIAITRISDNQLIDVNETWQEVTGYKREEVIGFAALDLNLWVNPKQREQLIEMLSDQGKVRGEMQMRRKSGEIGELLMSAEMIELEGEDYLLTMAQDITDLKRAEREIQEYADRIEVLLGIEKAITSTLDLDEVLDTIMTELKKVIPYDSVSLQILRGESLEILACRGFDRPDEVMGLFFPLDSKFPNQCVIEENKSLTIEDVAQEYPHFQDESSKYASGHIHSWLGVPLTSKGSVKGMIALDRSEVSPFSEIEIQLATAIANQAVLAIENARLFRDAQRRLERLSSLRQIDRTITGSMDLRITLNILLGHVLQQLEVDAAAILLYRPEMQNLEFVAGQGFRTQALQSTNLRLGQGFAGQAAFDRRIVQVFDLDQLQRGFSHSPEFRDEMFVAYVGVPLNAKGNIIGVLEIFHRQALNPNPEWIEFLETLAGQAAIAIDNLQLFGNLQTSNLQLRHAYDATIEGWAQALELHDPKPRGYVQQVVDLTLELAHTMDIDEKQLVHIRRGVLLHDVGKMGVSDHILQKPGRLTDDEWEIIRKHPVYAYKWLAPILYLKPALDIPHYHHEKWDGSGYPHGLKGDQIPLPARIFAVVDVWLALLSDRPYRKAWMKEKALAYIQEQSGSHFDPRVVEAFIELLKRE